jgi:hypothetical protein
VTPTIRWLAALVVPLLLVSACAGTSESIDAPVGSGSPGPTASTEFQLAQQRWTDLGPVSYRMTLTSSCGERMGLGVFRVTVTPRGIEVQPVDRWSDDTAVQTVPDLFDFITQASDNGAEVVDVDYDVELGYPKQIDVDYMVDAIDDEACYRVSDFEPLGLVD